MTAVAAIQAHVLVYSGFRRLCTQKKKKAEHVFSKSDCGRTVILESSREYSYY